MKLQMALLSLAYIALSACDAASPSAPRINTDPIGSKDFGASGESPDNVDDPEPAGPKPVISDELQAFELAAENISAASQPKLIRYLSLAHLVAEGQNGDKLKMAGASTKKLINELSWNSKIISLRTVDRDGLLLRVVLPEIGWTEVTWDKLAQSHPAASMESDTIRTLKERTGSSKPLLRADWFVTHGSVAPLYYELLGMPTKLADLEAHLGINISQNIANNQIIRAGFDNSTVSKNHRVAERHKSKFGYLWRSYEFGSATGKQDIFQNPLGPSPPGTSLSTGLFGSNNPNRAFVDDGSEFLFSLPNGLLGFFIADGGGRRLDKVPGRKDDPIVVGSGCMRCHTGGAIVKEDMVRSRVEASGNFPDNLLETVRKLYVSPTEFAAQIEQDREAFARALKALEP